MRQFLLIGALALSSHNLTFANDVKPTNDTGNSCLILLLNKPVDGVAEVLSKSRFVVIRGGELIPAELGRITQVKDYDRESQGRIALTTAKGVVATSTLGYALRIDVPFATPNAKIEGLATQALSRSLKYTLPYTAQAAKVIVKQGFNIELPLARKLLAAEFANSNHVLTVGPDKVRLYDLNFALKTPETPMGHIKKEASATDTFVAAAIHPVTGKIVAVDGPEIVVFDSVESRRTTGTAPKHVNQISLSKLGTKFFIREGTKLYFYEISGRKLGELNLASVLFDSAWDASDSMIALSTATETIVYNLETQQAIRIGKAGDQWRRLAWSDSEGILVTLGPSDFKEKSQWLIELWNPATGEKFPLSAAAPVLNTDSGYPYLTGIRGRLLTGDFSLMIVRQNGIFEDVVQGFGSPEDPVRSYNQLNSQTH